MSILQPHFLISNKISHPVTILPLKYFFTQKWSTSVTENFDFQTMLKSRQTLLKLIPRHYSELVSQITQIWHWINGNFLLTLNKWQKYLIKAINKKFVISIRWLNFVGKT